MLTLSLMVIGTAVVLFSSLAKPEHVDPMGIFGLPPVRAVRIGARLVSGRAARPTAMLSRGKAGARCAPHTAVRKAA